MAFYTLPFKAVCDKTGEATADEDQEPFTLAETEEQHIKLAYCEELI
jgi:hypothetical protein